MPHSAISDIDQHWMTQALAQARLALILSAPNPPVGCVIVRDGELLGAGHTQQVGGPHAEVVAMADVRQRGHSLQGATAYVTLEPCAHHGRTPPCADALIREGLARVVVALHDPNPLVAGQGTARLRAASIAVLELDPHHPQAMAARAIKVGFLSRMTQQRPWVRLKVAASLDGRTALPDGRSQWITSAAAREDGQHWRARASAVLTGIGTVLDDDPQMNVRAIETSRQPWRVVLDSHWRLPTAARMLSEGGAVHVYGLPASDEATRARLDALQATATSVDKVGDASPIAAAQTPPSGVPSGARAPLHLHTTPTAHGHVDLNAVLHDLAAQGCNELHVEAGARLNAAFIAADLVDEYLIYLAPKLIGPGRPLAALGELPDLAAAPTLAFHDVRQVGPDLRILAGPPGRLDDRTRAKA
jgi:diaminohydroxyphosphoribosylaminopyrimidine deaminase / 5-amino-6-(5-phosphoribosylamino)uracil reductase